MEGLLSYIKGQLDMDNPFVQGDSTDPNDKKTWSDFMTLLDKVTVQQCEFYQQCRDGTLAFTLILDDPLDNSFISSKGEHDDDLIVTHYVRTTEQDDEYGISDMKTEGYQALDQAGTK